MSNWFNLSAAAQEDLVDTIAQNNPFTWYTHGSLRHLGVFQQWATRHNVEEPKCFLHALPCCIPRLLKHPAASNIHWPSVFDAWTRQLALAPMPICTKAIESMQHALMHVEAKEKTGLSQQAFLGAHHALQYHDPLLNRHDETYAPLYIALGHLAAMTQYDGHKFMWMNATAQDDHAVARMIAQTNLPPAWRLQWFEHHAALATWLLHAKDMRPVLAECHPLTANQFYHLPWKIEASDNNRALMAAYFPQEYPILDMLAPNTAWEGHPLSPTQEFEDLHALLLEVIQASVPIETPLPPSLNE